MKHLKKILLKSVPIFLVIYLAGYVPLSLAGAVFASQLIGDGKYIAGVLIFGVTLINLISLPSGLIENLVDRINLAELYKDE